LLDHKTTPIANDMTMSDARPLALLIAWHGSIDGIEGIFSIPGP
jgi:hypothetical protein